MNDLLCLTHRWATMFLSGNLKGWHCCLQVKMAMEAVAQLHGQILRPKRVKKKRKKAVESDMDASPLEFCLWCRQVSGEGAHVKKWRLVLRNLPFKVSTCTTMCM